MKTRMSIHYKRLILGVVLLIGAVATGAGFIVGYRATMDLNHSLPPIGHDVGISQEKLATVVAIGMRGKVSETFKLSIPSDDKARFNSHLDTIASQRGWFIHHSDDWPRSIMVVLPVSELGELESLAQSPIAWVNDNIDLTKPAKGPSDLPLTYVRLKVDADSFSVFLKMTGLAILFIATPFLAYLGVGKVGRELVSQFRNG